MSARPSGPVTAAGAIPRVENLENRVFLSTSGMMLSSASVSADLNAAWFQYDEDDDTARLRATRANGGKEPGSDGAEDENKPEKKDKPKGEAGENGNGNGNDQAGDDGAAGGDDGGLDAGPVIPIEAEPAAGAEPPPSTPGEPVEAGGGDQPTTPDDGSGNGGEPTAPTNPGNSGENPGAEPGTGENPGAGNGNNPDPGGPENPGGGNNGGGDTPVVSPPVEVPPVGGPPVDVPPVEIPPVEIPPVEVPPIGGPPTEAPPAAPPAGGPPAEPPVATPPVVTPPVAPPPTETPPGGVPPVAAPPVEVPPEGGLPPAGNPAPVDGGGGSAPGGDTPGTPGEAPVPTTPPGAPAPGDGSVATPGGAAPGAPAAPAPGNAAGGKPGAGTGGNAGTPNGGSPSAGGTPGAVPGSNPAPGAAPAPATPPGAEKEITVSVGFVAEAVVSQSDGKLVVAGRQGDLSAGSSRAVLKRFNADGSIDASFGAAGAVVAPAGANDAFYALTLVGDGGGIVAAGTRDGDVLVARYDADGRRVSSFGNGGAVQTDLGSPDDAAYALATAPDGALVAAAGLAGDVVLARYTPAGTLDAAFGAGGRMAFNLGADDDVPSAVLVQPDGRIVAVGTAGGSVAALRALPNGQPDTGFSGDGVARVDGLAAYVGAGVVDRSAGVAIQPDGKLLVANRSAVGDFAVARLSADGAPDSAFGAAGIATVDFGGEDDADAVLVQETGEILLVGTSLAGDVGSTGVAALDASGTLITEFGQAGRLTLDADVTSSARELHVGDLVLRAFGARQADGRLIVGTGTRAANAAATSSSLRRLDVPGVRAQEQGSSTLGTFGTVNGRSRKLTYTDADGTTITFSLKGGTGTLSAGPDGRLNLSISDAPASGGTVAVRAKGGDGRVNLGDVMVGGTLKSFSLKTGDLSGTLFASGSIGKVTLGDVSGTVATAGSIGSVVVRKLTGARVMAGAALGADGRAGGAGANADTFTAAATLGTVKVADAMTASTVSAGVNPVSVVPGAAGGSIRSVSARQADGASQFIARKIGSLKLPNKVDPTSDARVTLMP